MKIIDGHIHIGKWSEIFLNYSTTVEEAVEVMKESGVEGAVAMPADATSNEELLSDIKKIKDFRFYFCAWINPEDRGLANFLEENAGDVKFLKYHPSLIRKRITDEALIPYLEIAGKHKLPVIVHCGRWQEIASFEYPIEAARNFPEVNFILAHLGGDQPSLCTAAAKAVKESGLKNLYLGTESVREFYFVNEVVKTAGAERILFGSDYNLGLPGMYIPIIEKLRISNEEKEMIFSGNILRLIK